MNLEFNPMEPALEDAVSDIRQNSVDDAVVEAAAARVWARIAEEARIPEAHTPLRSCADFQALIPDFKAVLHDTIAKARGQS